MKKLLGVLALAGTTLIACKSKTAEATLSAEDSAKIYQAQKAERKAVAPATTTVYKLGFRPHTFHGYTFT